MLRATAAARTPAPAAHDSKADGFSPDFQKFLQDNGYGKYDFARPDVPAFGGKMSQDEKITREPVILIHGNSDSAEGWEKTIAGLKAKGYKDSEIYALSYGDNNPMLGAFNYHSKDDLGDVRKFVEAVIEYTGAEKVDVISHSLGVTLTRKALKGGEGFDGAAGKYDLGDPLTDKVDTFVGIAGANHGLSNTWGLGFFLPTASRVSGLHPRSQFLKNINNDPTPEADNVFSIGGNYDQILGFDAGRSNHIPGEDGAFEGPWGHFGARNNTVSLQLQLIQHHRAFDDKKNK